MFSAQTRQDFATRGRVSENTLRLLSRAKGLDILVTVEEQAEYMVDKVDFNKPLPPVRDEFGEYLYRDMLADEPGLLHYRLDQVNYPVPGYAGYDAS